jgi:dihydrofolate synthase/folylpolyglutamate synthase
MAPDGTARTARREEILARLTRLHPRLIDLSLGRTMRLLERLGRPDRALAPVVHVAGTNGKGSTIAFLRAMHEAADRRVHVYTSPHLVHFNERIRLAGEIVPDDALIDLLTEVEAANAGEPITFFEVTTAAAFLAMARSPADLVLLETGLGGRYDSTHVVERPALTVLTPISLDHQAFLGDTLTAIAGEKAAIQKRGVPSLAGIQPAAALAVIRAAADAVAAPLRIAGVDWRVDERDGAFVWRAGDLAIPLDDLALAGRHQVDNAALAVAASQALAGLPVPHEAVRRGLATAEWPARLQRLDGGAFARRLGAGWRLWLDGGHNPAAGEVLADVVRRWRAQDDRLVHLVWGMMATKDAGTFLMPLAPLVDSVTTLTIPGEENALPAAELAVIARRNGIAATEAGDLADALDSVARRPPGCLLICGSLYLAGQVLARNG